MEKKIRVVTGKIGLDDHYRGIIVISDALRNAGMEVIYLGAGQRIEVVINAIIHEDADVVGLSFLCGGQVKIMAKFMARLKEQDLDHVLVIIGGIIHHQEIPLLKEMGVREVFLPGTSSKDVVELVVQEVEKRKGLECNQR